MKKILLGFIMDGRSGGLDTYLLHFVDAVWKEGMQIDLLTNEADPELKKHLSRYGSRLTEIATLKHPLKQFRQVKELIRKEKYDIVYLNVSTSMDMPAAFAAKSCQVPRRILHSHSGGNDCESPLKKMIFDILQRVCRPVFYRAGNEFCACSVKAGYWMFPRRIVQSENFQVIYNAVDRERFIFRPEVRSRMREELGIEHQFAVGHVGNFCYQKNHTYLIRIFKALHEKRPDSILLLVGQGIRLEDVKRQVEREGLSDAVRFLGRREDVDRVLQAMDVFLLPSHFEGLPTVGIEAQCTGLPCVISDSVTEETRISDRCSFVSLKESPEYWADEVIRMGELDRDSVVYSENAVNYDLREQKKSLNRLISGGKDE